jgi:hypothetical protein
MTAAAHTTAVKITTPTGEVEYRMGVVASAVVREIREAGGTIGIGEGEYRIAPIHPEKVPVEHGGGFTGEFKVGEFVTVEHIGVAKTGRIVKVTPTRVAVEVVVYGGTTRETTKVITRAKAACR